MWERWPNFSEREFRCKETGYCYMDPAFMDKLQELRNRLGEPLIINSGYRHPSHSVERVKAVPGTHTLGLAADIRADGQKAYRILQHAFDLGFTGIGVAKSFVHLDIWTGGPRPNVWIY